MAIVVISNFAQNHQPMKVESTTMMRSRLLSDKPFPEPRISRRSLIKPTSAPIRRVMSGIHVCSRLKKLSFANSLNGMRYANKEMPKMVIPALAQITMPPMRGVWMTLSESSCNLLNSVATFPSSATFPGFFFQALYLNK